MRVFVCAWLGAIAALSAAAWAQAPAPTTAPATRPTTRPAAASAERMLQQMLRSPEHEARPLRPAAGGGVDVASGSAAVAPGAPAMGLMREGSSIVDRTGRLVRSADGRQWEFAFDADAPALRDPPVVILPNLKLMAMEDAVGGNRPNLRFRISGDLTEYRGRNYLLLRKVLVVPESEGRF